jgi:acyl carrier protein
VKVRGYRIELGEIEAVLNEHRLVRQSVVVVSEDERGESRLLGYVVGEDGAESAELKRHVRERLPEYMVPEAIVRMEEMPLTVNGKIDRKRLASVKDAGRQAEREYVGPRTAVEEILAAIWGEVLNLEQVGILENFFDLGGHSLMATQVISRVREVFQVELAVRKIFEKPTIAALAREIEAAQRGGLEAPPIASVSREQELPLSFAQQRLWSIQQLEPDTSAYNTPAAIHLQGSLKLPALGQSLDEITRRHEALRTRFEVRAGRPAQVIQEAGAVEAPLWDLSGVASEEREAQAREIARGQARRLFDLERGPVWRAALLRLDSQDHTLLLCLHHAASDGWSLGVLVKELTALYRNWRAGVPSALPELPAQYADYALWQRQWLQGEALAELLGYWRRNLDGVSALRLGGERGRAGCGRQPAGEVGVELSPKLTGELKELSRRQGVTMFMTLLAAFQVTLGRYAGQQDVVVGADVANRQHRQTEGLIGRFVNELALRVRLEEELSFVELLERVREVTLGAYAHQELPYERVVEEVGAGQSGARRGLIEASLALQNMPEGEVESLDELKLELVRGEAGEATYSLTLRLGERQGQLVGVLSYARERISDADAELVAGQWEGLLGMVVGQPELTLSALGAQLDQLAAQLRATRNISLRDAFETRLSGRLKVHRAEAD